MAKVARMTISNNNPVGMIVSSMLTEAQFQTINGPSWVLADGRNVAGSVYATTTGQTTVPDLRGMVLRGKNNGRSDGNQDPGGERALGSFQNQGTAVNGLFDAGHLHGRGRVPAGSADGGNPNLGAVDGNTLSASANIQSGDNETRMRNMAVNHFIKINT